MRWFVVTQCVAILLSLQVGVAAAAPQDAADVTARVLELTNAERQKAGLAPLAASAQLANAAQTYSQVLAATGCFEHTCGPVPNFGDRDAQAGYTGWTAIGENIAAGYPSPEAVVAGWMASPGHRANILSPKYTELGVGVVTGAGSLGTYWTQEFGNRPGAVLDLALQPIPADEAPAPDDGSADDDSAESGD